MDQFRVILTYDQPLYFIEFVEANAKTVLTESIKQYYNEILKQDNPDVPREIFFKWFEQNSGLPGEEVNRYKGQVQNMTLILTNPELSLLDYKQILKQQVQRKKTQIKVKDRKAVKERKAVEERRKEQSTVKEQEAVKEQSTVEEHPSAEEREAIKERRGVEQQSPFSVLLNKSFSVVDNEILPNFNHSCYFTGILMLDFKSYLDKMYPIILRINRTLTGQEISAYILEAITSLKNKIPSPMGAPNKTRYTITEVLINSRVIYFLIE